MINSFTWRIWIFVSPGYELALRSFLVKAWQYNLKIFNRIIKTSLNGSLRNIINTCRLLCWHQPSWFFKQWYFSFDNIHWHVNFWAFIAFALISFMNINFIGFWLIWGSWGYSELIFNLFLNCYFIMILSLSLLF